MEKGNVFLCTTSPAKAVGFLLRCVRCCKDTPAVVGDQEQLKGERGMVSPFPPSLTQNSINHLTPIVNFKVMFLFPNAIYLNAYLIAIE